MLLASTTNSETWEKLWCCCVSVPHHLPLNWLLALQVRATVLLHDITSPLLAIITLRAGSFKRDINSQNVFLVAFFSQYLWQFKEKLRPSVLRSAPRLYNTCTHLCHMSQEEFIFSFNSLAELCEITSLADKSSLEMWDSAWQITFEVLLAELRYRGNSFGQLLELEVGTGSPGNS